MEKMDLERLTVRLRATLKQCANTKWVGETRGDIKNGSGQY